jgi:hypothetical protein
MSTSPPFVQAFQVSFAHGVLKASAFFDRRRYVGINTICHIRDAADHILQLSAPSRDRIQFRPYNL